MAPISKNRKTPKISPKSQKKKKIEINPAYSRGNTVVKLQNTSLWGTGISNLKFFPSIVESQYPLSVVHKTIEDSLENLDDFLAHMDNKDFEMSKAAVMSVKEDIYYSLRDQGQALWREIVEDTYDFTRYIHTIVFI